LLRQASSKISQGFDGIFLMMKMQMDVIYLMWDIEVPKWGESDEPFP